MSRVLIVEDDLEQGEALAEQVCQILGEETEVVGPLPDHRVALKEIQHNKFDIALLDVELNDHKYGGIHVADALRAKSKTPILFVTGVQDEKILRDTEEIDYSHFIQKPFDLEALRRGLNQLISFDPEKAKSDHPKVFYKAGVRDRYWMRESKNNLMQVNVKDILYVEARDHYCQFVIRDKKPVMIKARLKNDIYENSLSAYPFFHQLGRSFIINLNEIVKIEGNIIQFDDSSTKPIQVPKNARKELFQLLNIDDHERV